MPVAELFNVISPTFPYLAMWDTVQTKSSDRIFRGSGVCACACEVDMVSIRRSVGWLMKFMSVWKRCICTRHRIRTLARLTQAHTNLGVTMDSKGAFEVF